MIQLIFVAAVFWDKAKVKHNLHRLSYTVKNIMKILFLLHDSYLKCCRYLRDLRASNSAMISDCVYQGKVCTFIDCMRMLHFCILSPYSEYLH